MRKFKKSRKQKNKKVNKTISKKLSKRKILKYLQTHKNKRDKAQVMANKGGYSGGDYITEVIFENKLIKKYEDALKNL